MDYAAAYGELHKNQKHFAGISIEPHVDRIANLVRECGSQNLLDYGCGKGYQYLAKRVHEQWGGILPICYDVGVSQLSKRPEGKFQGVICTDMIEHIEESDVPTILADVFSFASQTSFVFLSVSCVPARKKVLPDGRNVHLTVKPPEWWDALLKPFERPGLVIDVAYDHAG